MKGQDWYHIVIVIGIKILDFPHGISLALLVRYPQLS